MTLGVHKGTPLLELVVLAIVQGITEFLVINYSVQFILVPGVSRSGITVTAALVLGHRRPEAAGFSLLLLIPTTVATGFFGAMALSWTQDAGFQTLRLSRADSPS